MTPAQWRLANRAEAIVRRDVGRSDDELAERLGVTAAELRPVLRALWATRRIDFCWSWMVCPPGRRVT